MSDEPTLHTRDVRRRFDRAAEQFDAVDFVHAVTREGLISRLVPLVIDAKTILDLGCATGSASPPLRKRFGRAHVISLDLSHAMLRQNAAKRRWFAGRSCVQADAVKLPFEDQSLDIVFANQLLPWIDDTSRVFGEISRVLRKGGLFAFATLGPDSLRELANAWATVDSRAHVKRFPDMHDVGDALVRAGLCDPVLDVDRLTVRYDSSRKLFADLTRMGARNTLHDRNRTLVGKAHFATMLLALRGDAEEAPIQFDLELVYGHCWGGGRRNDAADYRVEVASIPRRRR